MAKCTSCSARKGKRSCPALDSVICSQCCGTKRKVEINCPGDCIYLKSSQEYGIDKEESQKRADFKREMQSIIGNEGPYMDVLSSIEMTIYKFYQERGTINDKDVETALDHLFKIGKAHLGMGSQPLTELSFKIQTLVDAIDSSIMFQNSFEIKEDLMHRMKCLYRVLSSVGNHYDPSRECSYLNFIGSYLPQKD